MSSSPDHFAWHNNASLANQLKELAIQIIFWWIFIDFFEKYLELQLKTKYKRYYRCICKTKGGSAEFFGLVRPIPQHILSSIFIYIGIKYNSNNIFRSAIIAELAYEIIDLLSNWIEYIFDFNNTWNKDKELKLTALTFHHIPGIIVILPLNVLFGDNILFQNVCYSLLILTPFNLLFYVLYKMCDIYDLYQRTQFAVYFYSKILIFAYSRFVLWPLAAFKFIKYIFNDIHHHHLYIKILCVLYLSLISIFNIIIMYHSFNRGYMYMFGNIDQQIQTAKILQDTSDHSGFGIIQQKFRNNKKKNYNISIQSQSMPNLKKTK